MTAAFWIFLFLVVYCYFGYPFLIALLSRVMKRPVRRAEITPDVSVVISVYNEEDVIEAKIKGLLALDYPADKIEFLIGSDGSTDRTVEIIRAAGDPRIKVFAHPDRRGKMVTVTELVGRSTRPIIVFNDARQALAPDAVRNLVQNFADPDVGCASGELMFGKGEGGTARGINAYWEYEKFIRLHESRVHSMLGATGAFYAIRRELFTQGPADVVLDDMYTPLQIVMKGFRAVFDGTARAYDRTAHNPREEHRRKARTLYGNYQIFFLLPGVFNPFRSPVAVQMFSHKLLRVLVPFFLIAMLAINPFLLDGPPVYGALLWTQALFYLMAAAGALVRQQERGVLKTIGKLCYIPYVFCLLNFSALNGFYRFVRGKQEITWQKARHS